MNDAETRARIGFAARSWVGVPFQHQGRTRAGLDCWGLVVVSAQAAGFKIQDETTYPEGIIPRKLMAALLGHSFRIAQRDAAAGDFAVYGFRRQGHVGVLARRADGQLLLIHASPDLGVVEARFDPERMILRGVFRCRIFKSP